jgi:hypothetical protein
MALSKIDTNSNGQLCLEKHQGIQQYQSERANAL